MRGMTLAGISVLLCLAALTTSCQRSPQGNSDAQTEDVDAARVKRAADDASSRLRSGWNGLATVYVRSHDEKLEAITGVYVDDATAQLEAGKQALLSGLEGSGFDALRAHVERFYPRPHFVLVGFEPQPVYEHAELRPVAGKESVYRSFAAAEAYITKIEAVASGPVLDLTVKSTQERSTCKLFAGGRQKREVSTDDTTKNLARGYYTYTVTKGGYKQIEGDLDLVNDDGTLLDCVMYESTDTRGPDKCQFK
jgi:hypothetical protein